MSAARSLFSKRLRLRDFASALKRDALTAWIAARDPRTPLAAKLLAAAVAAYAFSPIDLIPDFIPVLGILDDLVLVPLGVWAVIRILPKPLIEEFRVRASAMAEKPISKGGAIFVMFVWLACLAAAGILLWT